MSNEIKVSSKLDNFKLALAQVNPAVGDVDGNLRKARAARTEAATRGADPIAFTELYLTGYPIEDLVLKPALQAVAREAREAFVHSNTISPITGCGGQDELVFDGAPFVFNYDGSLRQSVAASASSHAGICDGGHWRSEPAPLAEIAQREATNYLTCVTGLRDYVEKNGFSGVMLGLSGGIDSALGVAMAVDALGAKRVHGIMAYTFTSNESLNDAAATAEARMVHYDIMPIHPAVEGLINSLAALPDGGDSGTAEENLRSRACGTVLMGLSNKFGPMVITTGSKSEVSVGYATLYGDMNGSFNPINELYKTLARYRNSERPKGCLEPRARVIPENALTKAPTAELKHNQRDQDMFPPYDTLNDIFNWLVELEMPAPGIVAKGYAPEIVKKVERMLYLAEYKRRQAAPGVKITSHHQQISREALV